MKESVLLRHPLFLISVYLLIVEKISQTNTPINRSSSKDLESNSRNLLNDFRIIIWLFGSIIVKKLTRFIEAQLNQNTILT